MDWEISLHKGSRGYCEDRAGHNTNLFWVIDGATSIFEGTNNFEDTRGMTEPEYIAHLLNIELMRLDHRGKSLLEILNEAITKVQEGNPVMNEEYLLPQFTIAMVRVNDSDLEYYVLCDCTIFLFEDKIVLTDKRLEELDSRYKLDYSESKGSQIKQLEEVRKLANVGGGYYVGSLSGKGISEGLTGTVKKQTFIMCTDGVLDDPKFGKVDDATYIKYNIEEGV